MATGKRIEIDFNKIYQSNKFGDFKIIKELESRQSGSIKKRVVLIEFIQTGTQKAVDLLEAIKGVVSDPYYPTVAGVGYMGELKGKSYSKKDYDLWYHMIERCYKTDSTPYRFYGAEGVTVDKRWHCFANFLEDLPMIPGYVNYYNGIPGEYHLDKDELQQHIPKQFRIYSKQTCKFLSNDHNIRIASKDAREKKNMSSKYFGLYRTPYNTYQCTIMLNNIKYFLGTYNNEIAAANVYNFVAARTCSYPTLNDVPYMDINECFKHLTSRKPIQFPPNIKQEEIAYFSSNVNTSSKYIGVWMNEYGHYVANYTINGTTIRIGTFNNDIAAANAHNWYHMFYGTKDPKSLNNVPFMRIEEWLTCMVRYKLPPLKVMC